MSGIVERDWLIVPPMEIGAAVLSHVGMRYGIDPAILRSERTDQPVSRARQEAMRILRDELHWTFSAIGRLLGDRDHTTIMYGVKQARNRRDKNWNRP